MIGQDAGFMIQVSGGFVRAKARSFSLNPES